MEKSGLKSNLLSLVLKEVKTGTVYSKFKNGFNIKFNDYLVFVSYLGTPLSVLGLNIEKYKLMEVINSINIGDMVINKDENLIIYNKFEIYYLYYRNFTEIDLRIPKINCIINEVPNSNLFSYLESIDFKELIGIDLDNIGLKYIDLLSKVNKSNLDINNKIINYFIGRGKGLTPSGDDILIGFTLALMIFGNYSEWISGLKTSINSNKTTMVSISYFNALFEGYASESFVELVKLIDEDNIFKIEYTVKNVQAFGHTSGNDTLFGFLTGLRFLTKEIRI